MVPLQAIVTSQICALITITPMRKEGPTELLLDDLEDLLLIKFLGETLDSRQSLTTIALCE
jgi:hypothetical protein